eukprot:364712-Chlamydomonas_euryale.AAC.2
MKEVLFLLLLWWRGGGGGGGGGIDCLAEWLLALWVAQEHWGAVAHELLHRSCCTVCCAEALVFAVFLHTLECKSASSCALVPRCVHAASLTHSQVKPSLESPPACWPSAPSLLPLTLHPLSLPLLAIPAIRSVPPAPYPAPSPDPVNSSITGIDEFGSTTLHCATLGSAQPRWD